MGSLPADSEQFMLIEHIAWTIRANTKVYGINDEQRCQHKKATRGCQNITRRC